jgi:hypothetical protein
LSFDSDDGGDVVVVDVDVDDDELALLASLSVDEEVAKKRCWIPGFKY